MELEFAFPNELVRTKPYRCFLCKPSHDDDDDADCDKPLILWRVLPEGRKRRWNNKNVSPIISKSLIINPYSYTGNVNCSFKFDNLTSEHNGNWIIKNSFWVEGPDGLNISYKKNKFTIVIDSDMVID